MAKKRIRPERTHYDIGSLQPRCWRVSENPPLTTDIELVTCKMCLRLLSGLNSGAQKGPKPKENVTYRLSPTLIEQMADSANKQGRTTADVVEEVFTSYLQNTSEISGSIG